MVCQGIDNEAKTYEYILQRENVISQRGVVRQEKYRLAGGKIEPVVRPQQ
jgi:hypothetical protein